MAKKETDKKKEPAKKKPVKYPKGKAYEKHKTDAKYWKAKKDKDHHLYIKAMSKAYQAYQNAVTFDKKNKKKWLKTSDKWKKIGKAAEQAEKGTQRPITRLKVTLTRPRKISSTKLIRWRYPMLSQITKKAVGKMKVTPRFTEPTVTRQMLFTFHQVTRKKKVVTQKLLHGQSTKTLHVAITSEIRVIAGRLAALLPVMTEQKLTKSMLS